ncbi:glutathione S-transferase family protein [Archangium minus]|uniref:Glutathione S-transferase family protein n=1 Tax=Archangium minus TaxID=83450 RepID=A0ABY9WQ10_9BACT|nr:glutathione S-transferase family protein [Archangium minus]
MKLYFAPRTRAVRARWLLEELEVPYELVKLDMSKQETTTPAHLALHPLGEVPVLVDGATVLFESLAICLHLADRFPEKRLAPPVGSAERGPYLQWIVFAEVTLDPLVVEHYWNTQLPEEKKADLSRQHARLDDVLKVLDVRLDGREFIAGDSFTAADVVLASILHLAHTLKLLEGYPKLFEYMLRHAKRPATRRAVSG